MPERTNEHERFEQAALVHLEALYRFAVYLCRNEAEAEDLTQDTFLSAFQKAHQFRAGTNLKAWLFRIARNAHIDRLRRKRREPDACEINEDAVAGPDLNGGEQQEFTRWEGLGADDERVFFDLFSDEVNRFLGELPGDFRIALVLCDIEDFSYQEISRVLDCPVGTVRSRISRARGQLREKLYTYALEQGYVREGAAITRPSSGKNDV